MITIFLHYMSTVSYTTVFKLNVSNIKYMAKVKTATQLQFYTII